MKNNKLSAVKTDPIFAALGNENTSFLEKKAEELRLTVSDIKNLAVIACDLEMWGQGLLQDHWNESDTHHLKGKNKKQKILRRVNTAYTKLLTKQTDYSDFSPDNPVRKSPRFCVQDDESTILGDCPVASPKTRCCNLKTMDAVINCGFGCSYCSIQSFYHDDNVYFHKNLKKKLHDLCLDDKELYHIGTGQSSDSLMWGNKNNMLSDIFQFAREHPNVILELKSKSRNTAYLESADVPQNVFATWTLNTQTIIDAEEHGTASLKERINAARRTADTGTKVGFHFHPIIDYKGWEDEYTEIIHTLTNSFTPQEVVTVSLGTLTFIKPVIQSLRRHKASTRVHQIPLTDSAGKLSYPFETKLNLFSTVYNALSPWHGSVFFYMCMEDPRLWDPVFGWSYADNEEFEKDMKEQYMQKLVL
ncbi:MAG: radical SAM protein [Spirochaetia bacterium]